jgi:hypothetical protein
MPFAVAENGTGLLERGVEAIAPCPACSAPRPTVASGSCTEHSGPLPDEQWFQAVEPLHRGATEMLLTDYRNQREHDS